MPRRVALGRVGDVGNIRPGTGTILRRGVPVLQPPCAGNLQAGAALRIRLIGGELHTTGVDDDVAIPRIFQRHLAHVRPSTPDALVLDRTSVGDDHAVVQRGRALGPPGFRTAGIRHHRVALNIAYQRHRGVGGDIGRHRCRLVAGHIGGAEGHALPCRRRCDDGLTILVYGPIAVVEPVFDAGQAGTVIGGGQGHRARGRIHTRRGDRRLRVDPYLRAFRHGDTAGRGRGLGMNANQPLTRDRHRNRIRSRGHGLPSAGSDLEFELGQRRTAGILPGDDGDRLGHFPALVSFDSGECHTHGGSLRFAGWGITVPHLNVDRHIPAQRVVVGTVAWHAGDHALHREGAGLGVGGRVDGTPDDGHVHSYAGFAAIGHVNGGRQGRGDAGGGGDDGGIGDGRGVVDGVDLPFGHPDGSVSAVDGLGGHIQFECGGGHRAKVTTFGWSAPVAVG